MVPSIFTWSLAFLIVCRQTGFLSLMKQNKFLFFSLISLCFSIFNSPFFCKKFASFHFKNCLFCFKIRFRNINLSLNKNCSYFYFKNCFSLCFKNFYFYFIIRLWIVKPWNAWIRLTLNFHEFSRLQNSYGRVSIKLNCKK